MVRRKQVRRRISSCSSSWLYVPQRKLQSQKKMLCWQLRRRSCRQKKLNMLQSKRGSTRSLHGSDCASTPMSNCASTRMSNTLRQVAGDFGQT